MYDFKTIVTLPEAPKLSPEEEARLQAILTKAMDKMLMDAFLVPIPTASGTELRLERRCHCFVIHRPDCPLACTS